MRYIAALFALGIILPGPAVAQEIAPPLMVDDAVRLAVTHSPRLLGSTRDVAAAAAGVRSASALANPEITFTPGITSISGTGEEFLARQPLEINGTRSARAAAARAGYDVAQAQAVAMLREVVFTTKTAYYELVRAREQAAVARDALQVAREFDRIARRQVEEGARAGIDLAQTGLEVARAERDVTLAEGGEAAARAALNTALGRAPGDPIGSLSPLPTPADVPVTGEDVASIDRALVDRAEIRVEEKEGERFRQEARLARAEGNPDLAPQFRVGYFTRGWQPADSGNGAGIGLAISLPLFDYGSRRNRARQAEESARAQEARAAAVRNEVRREITSALARKRAFEAVVRSYQGGVLDQAQRLLNGSRIGFREGRTSVVALIEAQRSYRTVQSEYRNALADAAIAAAELERALGAVPASLLPGERP